MTKASIFGRHHTESLYNDLRAANTEQAKKERFLQYVTTTFAGDKGAQKLIAAMTLGAERTIANIPRGSKIAHGRADSQTDTIIIEWERDLARTGEHAREQLQEYLEGNWRSGQEYRFVLLATDGIRWRKYAPDWSGLDFGGLQFGTNFSLRETRRFDLAPDHFDDFPFFLDEVLFASEPKPATLENIQNDFGDTSSTFINSIAALQQCSDDLEKQTELKVAFEQWRRFLSIAYGRFDDSPIMFLVHTYLSVFAKFIAYSVITRNPIVDDKTIVGILNGTAFRNLNIDRFVEDDFFHWVATDRYVKRLRPLFREINLQLQNYDFSNVQEDILKGVYQELIDLDTRHALGEYYTPDWLCERIVGRLEISQKSSFLDPACGSGSFLRAIITRLRSEYPKLSAEAIAEQVVGIDIHPLSVLIAKTTVLLALSDHISKAKRPVSLHIYLANSLLVPRGTADLFQTQFQVAVDNKSYVLDLKGVEKADQFDELISFCDDMVGRYPETLERTRFSRLSSGISIGGASADLPSQLFDIYRGMKTARDQGRDSIWKFILQNSYKPVFLMKRFDFVVGNPPWLTYASVTNGEYQTLLRQLSDAYEVTPENRANMPHLEIAAIFLAHAVNYFLRPSGQLAFVLPRSFMSADQHDNSRAGIVKGVKLTEAWDLDGVSPLFRVPCCVLFAVPNGGEQADRAIPDKGISGELVTGRLPRPQIHWEEAKAFIAAAPSRWYYSRLQGTRGRGRSALTAQSFDTLKGSNAYASRFHQGATIVPRNFFFVELDQKIASTDSVRERVLTLKTDLAVAAEAKEPWKSRTMAGRAEGQLLYRTAISRNIIPFALLDPLLVLLPLVITDEGTKDAQFTLLDSEGLLERKYRHASQWFHDAEKIWDELRTDVNRQAETGLSDYLNWQSKLTNQKPNARFLVLYTSSATDASAVLVDRRKFDHPFVVDHKAYWCECGSEAEGHYLAAYLNSGYANGLIKEFQSRGLFGPRDIHKTIVKIPFPKFNRSEEQHQRLAKLGESCAELAGNFVAASDVSALQARQLGSMRSRLREQLSSEMDSVDALVETLSTGRSEAVVAASRKRRSGSKTGSLFDV